MVQEAFWTVLPWPCSPFTPIWYCRWARTNCLVFSFLPLVFPARNESSRRKPLFPGSQLSNSAFTTPFFPLILKFFPYDGTVFLLFLSHRLQTVLTMVSFLLRRQDMSHSFLLNVPFSILPSFCTPSVLPAPFSACLIPAPFSLKPTKSFQAELFPNFAHLFLCCVRLQKLRQTYPPPKNNPPKSPPPPRSFETRSCNSLQQQTPSTERALFFFIFDFPGRFVFRESSPP